MDILFVVYHPCYCTGTESIEISLKLDDIKVIPRKGDMVRLVEFLPENSTGITADLIKDGTDWRVESVTHSKNLIIIEF